MSRSLLWLAAIASLLPFTAAAMTADEYFADGNRLFRDDLYWAALLRYRQAADAGLDTAVLDYNTGVAQYRARQHHRARSALLAAAEDPELRDAAHYNLGLNAYALGDREAALRWFRLASAQSTHSQLAAYAEAAIARLQTANEMGGLAPVAASETDKAFANLELRARVSYEYDNNIFRSPDRPYVDFSAPGSPRVEPTVQSGVYIPVSLAAKYTVNSLPFEGFYGAYRMAGSYYGNAGRENANEYVHEASFGNVYERQQDDRERKIVSAFTVAQHDEIYYDPDDGSRRNVAGVNVDSRMDYLRYGPEITLRQSLDRFSFGAALKGQLWNYEKTEVVPEYDHEYFLLKLFGQYRFSDTSLLKITVAGYSRRFSDRPSHDLDGQQRIGNPSIRYDYFVVGLHARQRTGPRSWFGVDFKRTERDDQYRGYNDFGRNSYSLQMHWTPTDRLVVQFNGSYHHYDYPNAFAFHNPVAGRKTRESADAMVSAAYQLADSVDLIAEARYAETESTDIRMQFDRTQYLLGVRWQR
jgi:tetratricopeptide (TPR) repeat protein